MLLIVLWGGVGGNDWMHVNCNSHRLWPWVLRDLKKHQAMVEMSKWWGLSPIQERRGGEERKVGRGEGIQKIKRKRWRGDKRRGIDCLNIALLMQHGGLVLKITLVTVLQQHGWSGSLQTALPLFLSLKTNLNIYLPQFLNECKHSQQSSTRTIVLEEICWFFAPFPQNQFTPNGWHVRMGVSPTMGHIHRW